MKILIIYLLLTGCSTIKDIVSPPTPYQEVSTNPLALSEQFLGVHSDYRGYLINNTCIEFDGAECVKETILKYDMNDVEFRRQVNEFSFSCMIGGKLYAICLDKPGFCRNEHICVKWKKKLFSRKKVCKKYEDKKYYVPISDYEFLLRGNTECRKNR